MDEEDADGDGDVLEDTANALSSLSSAVDERSSSFLGLNIGDIGTSTEDEGASSFAGARTPLAIAVVFAVLVVATQVSGLL